LVETDPSRATIPKFSAGPKVAPSKLQLVLSGIVVCVLLYIFRYSSLLRDEDSRLDGSSHGGRLAEADEAPIPVRPLPDGPHLELHKGNAASKRERVRQRIARWQDVGEEKKEMKTQKRLLYEEKQAVKQEGRLLKEEEKLLEAERKHKKDPKDVEKQLAKAEHQRQELHKKAENLHKQEEEQESKFNKLEQDLQGVGGNPPGKPLMKNHEKVLKEHHDNEKKAHNLEKQRADNAKQEDKLHERLMRSHAAAAATAAPQQGRTPSPL